MLEKLGAIKSQDFDSIGLEVVKYNTSAYKFYIKHGFVEQEDRGCKYLMRKEL